MAQVATTEKMGGANTEIDRLVNALDARVALAKTRADCLTQAKLAEKRLTSAGKELSQSLRRIKADIDREEAVLDAARKELLTARKTLQEREAEALLDDQVIERVQDELTAIDLDADSEEIERLRRVRDESTNSSDQVLLRLHKEAITLEYIAEENGLSIAPKH